MSELRTNPDGSMTIGPIDRFLGLVEALDTFAEMTKTMDPPASQREALRRLAWFLGDIGYADAAERIMKHAAFVDPSTSWTPWGYIPIP